MSLVGPEPCLPYEYEHTYDGINTDAFIFAWLLLVYGQVSGRSEQNFDEMVVLDLYYMETFHAIFDYSMI